MASIKDLFGEGSTARQLLVWGVLQQVLVALMSPALIELQQLVDEAAPVQALTPSEMADLVARGHTTADKGRSEARKSGISESRFDQLVAGAMAAVSAGDAAKAHRLGLIGKGNGDPESASMTGAFRAAGIREDWWPILEQLTQAWPSPDDALTAALVGWFDEGKGKALYEKLGGIPEYFDMLYYSKGSAPTPTQLLELWNRGIIPKDSGDPNKPGYVQGFLQGPWRNQWLPVFEALREYLPPPRTVTAMVRSGGLAVDTATDLLIKQGLSPDLAAAYIHDAQQDQSAADKDLTRSQVVALYSAQLVTKDDAVKMLEAIGYDKVNAEYILALADLRREISALNSAVARVQSLYTGHKINRATAISAMNQLNIPADQVQGIVKVWDINAAANVKTLTESQIVDAWSIKVLTQSEAITELQGIGYTARDAWTLLSIKNKEALPDKPAAGPSNPLAG